MTGGRFEDLLERTIGLSAGSIGASAIRRAIDLRLKVCALDSDDAYWGLLRQSPDELQELIENVVVPETWFFRDPHAFAALARMAAMRGAGKGRPLRLLSVPCSTGEEPYTMAMALLDAGLAADAFRIEALDISARALMRARFGVYGRNSFRGAELGFRDRHFAEVEGGYRIGDAVRAPVRFASGNLLDPGFLAGAEPFDIIFCRNLLIYFDAPTQDRAIAVLKGLLADGGTLFVGHSESGLMLANGFASAKIPMAFAFRAAPASHAPPAIAAPAPVRTALKRKAPSARPAPAATARARASRRPAPVDAPASLDDLRRMADSGRLDEAAHGCRIHVRQHGPSSEAFLLLALISDSRGESDAAAEHYRKALYLDPDNADALSHLALLLRKQGDVKGARQLQERMRRHLDRRTG